jgi:pimeloyl-ACP methyl ester carboxylesterase
MGFETTTSADGTTIAYEVEGQGPPIVLIGGAFNTRHMAAGVAAQLADRFTTHRFDRRGRGDSGDTTPYAVEREVEDVAALLDVAGRSAAVYGHSSGAILALRAAAAGLPITAVVAYEPPYGAGWDDDPELWSDIGAALERGDRRAAARRFMAGAGAPEEWFALMSDEDWVPFETVAHTLPYDHAVTGDAGPHPELAQITVPTTVVVGGASPDWFKQAGRAVADLVPGATLLELEGMDHGVPDEVIAPVIAAHPAP